MSTNQNRIAGEAGCLGGCGSHEARMAAFDKLPFAVRKALAEASNSFCTCRTLDLLASGLVQTDQLVRMIYRRDDALDAAMRKQLGWE